MSNTPEIKKNRALQSILILVFAGLFILLQSAPRKSNPKSLNISDLSDASRIEADILQSGKESLDSRSKDVFEGLLRNLEKASGENKIAILDSIVVFWDVFMKPDVSVLYYLKKAELSNLFDHWVQAGDRLMNLSYFPNFQEKHWALHKATDCFRKAVDLNPNDLEANIKLASSIVETGENPMEGISMLRTLENDHPENIEIILQLARFSIQSGQFDKAIERYYRVQEIAPEMEETNFYLGEAYALSGDKAEAGKYFSKYLSTVTDPFVVEQLEDYISELLKN